MAALASLIASILLLHLWVPPVRQRLTQPFVMEPLLRDAGFNPVNTALLVVLYLIGLGWFFSLFRKYGERVDERFALVSIAYMVPFIGVRVLEDSDLFAPFAYEVFRHDPSLPASTTCLPELGPRACVDIFLVTPLIWIAGALVGWLAFRSFWEAQRVASIRGPRYGSAYFAGLMVAVWCLYGAVWASAPTFVRFVPDPVIGLLGAIAAISAVAWLTERDARFDWRLGIMGVGIFVASIVGAYLFVWAYGGRADWGIRVAPQAWPIAVIVGVPVILWGALRLQDINKDGRPKVGLWGALYVALLDTLLIFVACLWTVLAMMGRSPDPAWLAMSLILLAISTYIVRRHLSIPFLGHLLRPLNLSLLLVHVADAFITSIAVDVLGASEKHVLARNMMELVESLGLPDPVGQFPMAVFFVPFKLAGAFAFIAAIEHLDRLGRVNRDLTVLGRLGIMVIGLGPAVRDALRLALAL